MEVDAHTPDLVAVGIDGSDGGPAVLAMAAEEARAHGRHLCVYHCWQPPVQLTAMMPAGLPPTYAWQGAQDAATAVLERATSWLRARYPGLPMTATVLEGPAGRRLVAHVRRGDLLVLGLGTRHRIAARVLGSTVDYALRHARGTVLAVPPDGREEVKGPFSGHVVAAVDATDAASAVVGAGFAEAAAHRWPLAVVHADRHHRGAGRFPDGELLLSPYAASRHLLSSAVESWQARYPQVAVHRSTFEGSPAMVLEHAAAGARMLVVGRSSHPARLLRLTDLLLSRVSCPVAVTPLAGPAGAASGTASAAGRSYAR